MEKLFGKKERVLGERESTSTFKKGIHLLEKERGLPARAKWERCGKLTENVPATGGGSTHL